MEIDHTCANDACNCHVDEKDQYCSDECCEQARSGLKSGTCECQHADCNAASASRPDEPARPA